MDVIVVWNRPQRDGRRAVRARYTRHDGQVMEVDFTVGSRAKALAVARSRIASVEATFVSQAEAEIEARARDKWWRYAEGLASKEAELTKAGLTTAEKDALRASRAGRDG